MVDRVDQSRWQVETELEEGGRISRPVTYNLLRPLPQNENKTQEYLITCPAHVASDLPLVPML